MPTPKFDALISQSPELMSELMTDFISGKEYNARAKVRMKMKILLDLASVDTKYPDIPALSPQRPSRGDLANYVHNGYPLAAGMLPGGGGRALNQPGDGIEPIPGAYPERENDDILEAPGGNVPAPAAPAAPVDQNF
jgi:hypothetical protein